MPYKQGYHARWTYEAPRWRTVLLSDRPVRLFWPHLAFYSAMSQIASATLMLEARVLYAFALEGPLEPASSLHDFPLTFYESDAYGKDHPFVQPWISSQSHIDDRGRVCFNHEARNYINEGRDSVEVFWNSGFSVFGTAMLKEWRASSEADVIALKPFGSMRYAARAEIAATRMPEDYFYSDASWLSSQPRGDDSLVAQG